MNQWELGKAVILNTAARYSGTHYALYERESSSVGRRLRKGGAHGAATRAVAEAEKQNTSATVT